MLRRFRLEEPESVKEASEILARFGETARVYAGGTELLLGMKEGLIYCERLVNVKKISGLDQVQRNNGSLEIGALATHRTLEKNSLLNEVFPAFAALERNVANVRVREVGTLGGNLCFAEPHSDPAVLLLVLDGVVTLEKSGDERQIPLGEFFTGALETSRDDDEILTRITVKLPEPNTGAAYLKFGYLERPSVGVAVLMGLSDDGKTLRDFRIAVGSAGPMPKRVPESEELLREKSLKEAESLLIQAGERAAKAAEAMTDIHGSAEYKEHIIGVLTKRAFRLALERAEGKTR